jgi:thymidylate synthase
MVEHIGALLKLTNPRARLSRTETRGVIFSCLGEFLWYLAGKSDLAFISYYISKYEQESEDGLTVYGGYGPRLFNKNGSINQIHNAVELLKKRPTSRRAVIQLFDAKDIVDEHKEVPCTCTLQLLIRGKKLCLFVNMRSNDAFLGLPHDVFAFTMLQEVIARLLGVELGAYYHAVGSLHLYYRNITKVQKYLSEGWQSTVIMPPMPAGDPSNAIRTLLKLESSIRCGRRPPKDQPSRNGYWGDLIRLLQIYWYHKRKERAPIRRLKARMSSSVFNPYIEAKQKAKPEERSLEQLDLELPGSAQSG